MALHYVAAAAAFEREERVREGSVELLGSGGNLRLAGPHLVDDDAACLVVRLIVGNGLRLGVRKGEDEEP